MWSRWWLSCSVVVTVVEVKGRRQKVAVVPVVVVVGAVARPRWRCAHSRKARKTDKRRTPVGQVDR